jgi:aspartyl-tRNA(Asn)/glutamyl-tRNA(Gln) amidotransferase subunit C
MLSREELARIARLARIHVSDTEAPALQAQVGGILHLVEQMCAVDTAGVAPMAHPQDAVQRLRRDEVTEPDQREAFQAVAPKVEDGLYLVPKVIE